MSQLNFFSVLAFTSPIAALILLASACSPLKSESSGKNFRGLENNQSRELGRPPTDRWLLPGIPEGGTAINWAPITVLDSGIDITHPQVGGYVVEQKDFTGEGLGDLSGHGTAVALVTLKWYLKKWGTDRSHDARHDLPGLRIGKVVTKDGKPSKRALMEGIRWAVERGHGAGIVIIRSGLVGPKKEFQDLCDLIAENPNVQFSASAGNLGYSFPVYPAACSLPNLESTFVTDSGGNRERYSGKGTYNGGVGTKYFISEAAFRIQEGDYYRKMGNNSEARKKYEESLVLKPTEEALVKLGYIEVDEGNLDAAANRFQSAIALSPKIAVAHMELGVILGQKKQYSQAEKALLKAAELAPTEGDIIFNLGVLYRLMHRYDEMLRQFEKLYHIAPEFYETKRSQISEMLWLNSQQPKNSSQ